MVMAFLGFGLAAPVSYDPSERAAMEETLKAGGIAVAASKDNKMVQVFRRPVPWILIEIRGITSPDQGPPDQGMLSAVAWSLRIG